VIALITALFLGSASFIGTVIFRNESIASALLVGAALMVATVLKGVQMGVLAGFGRFRAIATVHVVEAILAVPLVFVLARAAGVNGVIGGLTVAAAVAYSLALLLGRRDLAGAKQASNGALGRDKAKDLLSYTVPTFLGDLVATPTLWFCVALLARSEHGLEGLGQYNAAYQWHGPLMFIPATMMSAATPTLVQQWELGNSREFMRITGLLCVAMILISLPPLLVAIMFKEQINLFYGPSYDGIGLMVVLLILAAPLHGISKVAATSLQAMGRSWYLLSTNFLYSMTVGVVAFSAIPALGGLGLCIALVAAYFFNASLNVVGVLKAAGHNNRSQI
jgi:O-antigen/teichoic acid export membrane protein